MMKLAQLWKYTKNVNLEVTLNSQLESAGSQRERVLENYKKNMGQTKRYSTLINVMTAIFVASISITVIPALFEINSIPFIPATIDQISFSISFTMGYFQTLAFIYIVLLKLFVFTGFMSGNSFKFLRTLPISNKDLEKLTFLTFIRMIISDLVVILGTIPVFGLLITGSVGFFITSFFSNFMLILFANGLLITISSYISRNIMKPGENSTGKKFLKILVGIGYIIGFMAIFIIMNSAISFIENILTASPTLSLGDVNNVLSWIIFPFSANNLVALSIIPAHLIPMPQLIFSIIGTGIFAIVSFLLIKSGLKGMRKLVYKQDVINSKERKKDASVNEVYIEIGKPVTVLVKKNAVMLGREFGNLMNYLIALALPLMLFIMPIFTEYGLTGENWGGGVIYLGFQVYMVHAAISGGEEKLGGVFTSLPLNMYDIFNARRFFMYLNQLATTVIIMIITVLLAPNPAPILIHESVLFSVALFTVPTFLILYSIAFGTLNNQRTLFMVHIGNKFAKLAGIIILIYIIALGELLLIDLFTPFTSNWFLDMIIDLAGLSALMPPSSLEAAYGIISIIWLINGSLAVILELIARKMFR